MDLERLLVVLHTARVRFIIVRGVAATIHGSSRLTQDIDVVYARTPENLDNLAVALSPFHPYLRGAPNGLPFEGSARTSR